MKTILKVLVATIVAMDAGVAAIMFDWSDRVVIAATTVVLLAVGMLLGVFDMPEDDHRAIRRDMHHDKDDMDNVA